MSDRIQEVAERANVPEDFVQQLVAAGALPGEEGELEFAGAVRRVRLLRSWTAAGLSVETILTLVNRGVLRSVDARSSYETLIPELLKE